MALSWKQLDDIAARNTEDYLCKDSINKVTVEETTRLIWCARKYKETMREYSRFFKTHKIKNIGDLAKRIAEIEQSK